MRRACVLVLALAACEKPGPTEKPADGGATEGGAPEERAPCTDVAELGDLAWVPASATRLAAFDLADPGLDASLAKLSELARAPGHGLPIAAAFAMANWSIEVPAVRGAIAAGGMSPGALVQLEIDGTIAWAWPATCDLDRLERALASSPGLSWRDASGFSVATAEGEAKAGFPFDLVALPGDRFALVAPGRAAALADALARAPAPGTAPPSLAVTLEAIEPAPVRATVRDRGLLDPQSSSAGVNLAIRATPDGARRVEPAAPG